MEANEAMSLLRNCSSYVSRAQQGHQQVMRARTVLKESKPLSTLTFSIDWRIHQFQQYKNNTLGHASRR